MHFSAERLKQKARDMGFNLVGVTRATPSPTLDAYKRWIEAGMHGAMGYMARPDRVIRRQDLQAILPGSRSLVLVGLDYRTLDIPDDVLNDPARGRIASYAWGLDYHDILTPRLGQLADWLAHDSAAVSDYKVYVDTGAILERSHAQQADMGFVGKNTMLIHPRRGSYFFLGEIITTLAFDAYDTPHRATMCGTCTRCLSACPTDAFPQPYVLDARRCISYHTIENKGVIDRELRADFGNWVFGCDVCQDVCPFQRFSLTSAEKALYPVDVDRAAPPLADLLRLDAAAFKARFAGSPLERPKRARLVRNACIAAGNSGLTSFVPALRRLLNDANALVRAHAAWGLWQLAGDDARVDLVALRDRDPDPLVQTEVTHLLAQK